MAVFGELNGEVLIAESFDDNLVYLFKVANIVVP